MNQEKRYKDGLLILLALDGELSQEQFAEFDSRLREDALFRRYYIELMGVSASLGSFDKFPVHRNDLDGSFLNQDMWLKLAEYEKTAPEIEIPKEKPQRELIQPVVYPARQKYKLSKFNKFTLAACAATVLFFLYLNFALQKPYGQEVATLTDTINAKWGNTHPKIQKGARLVDASETLVLKEGLAELTFDNQAKVVLEAPSEFQILANDRIGLTYGKAYATVPSNAIGFSVYTQNAKIIDLGTEFGVMAETDGDTQLHVLKGKTSLITGGENGKPSVEVTKDNARRVSGVNQQISDIPCNTRLFVREIDSLDKLVWRGEMEIDLADIVGEGNGFGTGRERVGIDPQSGDLTSNIILSNRQHNNQYYPVPQISGIDGVFVPSGQNLQTVTSHGHIFKECPGTDGTYWLEITNYPITSVKETIEGDQEIQLASLNGIQYGTRLHPAIMMHANTGITFDLSKIRPINSNGRIERFTSLCGLSDTLKNTDFWSEANAVIYVLIDGRVRKTAQLDTKSTARQKVSIDVSISDNDQFLTLVVTDGENTKNGDWVIFGDPVLKLNQWDK